MAMIQGSDITTEAITEAFQKAVIDKILSEDVYHAGKIPMCRGYQCVPTNMMDHLDNVKKNLKVDVGQTADTVSATVVLNGLINAAKNLTRVGSFAFTVNLRHTESAASYLDDPAVSSAMKQAAEAAAEAVRIGNTYPYDKNPDYGPAQQRAKAAQAAAEAAINKWKADHANDTSGDKSWTTEEGHLEGKVIFSKAEIRESFGAPSDIANTKFGETIVASNLNTLIANIYNHWYNYDRKKYEGSVIVCHTSCHFNCHSNCHYNCHSACHGWTVIKNDI